MHSDLKTPPSPPTQPIVLFDAACPLCQTLAAHAQRRAATDLRFASWQDFQLAAEGAQLLPAGTQTLSADRLRVLDGQTLLEGEAAWSFLIANYRDLSALNWLAAKIGLQPQLARAAATTGFWARRLCRSCPRPQRR